MQNNNENDVGIHYLHKGKSRYALPIITCCYLLVIICFTVVRMHNQEQLEPGSLSLSTVSLKETITADDSIGNVHKGILTDLYNVIRPADKTGYSPYVSSIYFNTLQEYINRSGRYISSDIAVQVENRIGELNNIIKTEHETDFTRMSIDGRNVAIYLSQKIYELYGLNISYDKAGNIERIEDGSDNDIYRLPSTISQNNVNYSILILVLIFIIILTCVCIIIAKKYQLFFKDVEYDGFNKKRYA